MMDYARPREKCLTKTTRTFLCEWTDGYGNPDFQFLLHEFQEAAYQQVEDLDVGKRLFRESRLVYVLMREKIELKKAFEKGRTYTLVTYPLKGTRLEMPRDAYVLNDEDEVVCLIDSLWILIDWETRRIAMAGQVNEVFNRFEEIQTYERVFPDRLYRMEEESPDSSIPYIYKVRTSDIDENGHMNNTMYFRILQERGLPGFAKTLEINFEKECFLDDELKIYSLVKDKGILYEGYLPEDRLSFLLQIDY